jgi:transposase
VALRVQMVLLSSRGYSVHQIAEILEEGEGTVRTWLRRYQQQGSAGLVDLPRPGRPRKRRSSQFGTEVLASRTALNWWSD